MRPSTRPCRDSLRTDPAVGQNRVSGRHHHGRTAGGL